MVPAGIADVTPWRTWDSAVEGLLGLLHEHVGWDVWMITRVVDDRQIVLRSCPQDAVRPGAELPWERSLCRQMIEGRAPRLATVTAAVPAYAHRTRGPIRDVAAYVGVPLVGADLTLFGSLCGVAFRAKPRSAARELVVVEAAARVLSTLMAAGMEPPAVAGSPVNVPRIPARMRSAM
jgi:GAF domain-containing protein